MTSQTSALGYVIITTFSRNLQFSQNTYSSIVGLRTIGNLEERVYEIVHFAAIGGHSLKVNHFLKDVH